MWGGDSKFFILNFTEEDVKEDLLNSLLKNEQMTQQ